MKYILLSAAALSAPLYITSALSSNPEATSPTKDILNQADHTMTNPSASPVRRIERNHNKTQKGHHRIFYRTINGRYNNLNDHEMNATDTEIIRITEAGYSDQASSMAGSDRPSPRKISNAALAQTESKLTSKLASDFLWQWGQFLDHDIDITDGVVPEELAPISIPTGDPQFDPDSAGNIVMNFNRSIYEPGSNPRQQLNEITGWIDASNVYGSDEERATSLRKMNGSGKLKTSKKGLLPFNTAGLSNAGGSSESRKKCLYKIRDNIDSQIFIKFKETI